MKFSKIIVATAIGTFLVSCNSVKKIAVPQGVDTSVIIPSKKVFTEEQVRTWSHADLATDSIPGISLAEAYEFLKNRKSVPVIVAVTDSGSDITHEDLASKVWTNPKEIAGNGVDDDKNGFIDDVHGWNFLGQTYDENLELTRMYRMQKPLYEGKTEADFKKEKDLKKFQDFKALEEDFKSNLERVKKGQAQYMQYEDMLKATDAAMQDLTGKEEYTLEDLKAATSTFDFVNSQKQMAIKILESGSSVEEQLEQLEPAVDYYTSQVNSYYNLEFNGRAKLNDDGYSMKTKVYGDNNVKDQGDDEIHGTHVSGIILADRNNHLGVNGVVDNALLMAVRVVPNGDEYDKDVALGIRYAVDNGAKVINTSFGKGYSPNAEWVYEAIKYAAKKDVLIVNAAGNDGENIDEKASYPKDIAEENKEISDNFLTVGAATRFYNENLPADFTNYGKSNVDVFAPGHDIYNTVPDNKYKSLSGTSMASPATAGVAALIRSYFPELSASQVKHIIMNSGTLVNLEVLLPNGEGKLVPFTELSKSGRLVNAYNAVKMAAEMVDKKK
ncbi:S8 family peptidase [Wenyingzhuangia marina]|uniref:Subtilase family protein n=1 Tax=Wenyingzhuangia marina TaxID=1195760 RepID=A0A1M5SN67_9FLAO|nr:S8 family peptidase [Wenyingzhuangia marina]GGF63116.1 peptidase S8 [Wenyingzhuangia marina]SHH39935.1 Subtilase family protein [Wenyingzhuangia marina]